jgi:hypothetical protein
MEQPNENEIEIKDGPIDFKVYGAPTIVAFAIGFLAGVLFLSYYNNN